MPGPFGFGSAEIERCKVAVKSDVALLDTEKVIVSPGRADNLSEYPAIKTSCINEHFFLIEVMISGTRLTLGDRRILINQTWEEIL